MTLSCVVAALAGPAVLPCAAPLHTLSVGVHARGKCADGLGRASLCCVVAIAVAKQD